MNLYNLYKRGPRAHSWTGVCEVKEDASAYRHFPQWPESKETHGWTRFSAERLDQLVATQEWVKCIDPDLVVDGGL